MTKKNKHRWLEGDILQARFGYYVFVVKLNGILVGRLLCPFGHSCEDIPYSLSGSYKLVHRDATKMTGKSK